MKRLFTGLILLVCFAGSTSYAQGQDNQTDTSAVKAVKDTISKFMLQSHLSTSLKWNPSGFTMPTSCWLIHETRACQLVGMM
jgi:hypothetical protein